MLLNSGQNNLVAGLEGDDGFFPVRGPSGLSGALTAGLAMNVHGVDPDDFDFEKLLHRLADLGFVGAAVGDDGVLVEFLALASAFFGQAGSFNDFKSVHGQSFSRPSTFSKALRLKSSLSTRRT